MPLFLGALLCRVFVRPMLVRLVGRLVVMRLLVVRRVLVRSVLPGYFVGRRMTAGFTADRRFRRGPRSVGGLWMGAARTQGMRLIRVGARFPVILGRLLRLGTHKIAPNRQLFRDGVTARGADRPGVGRGGGMRFGMPDGPLPRSDQDSQEMCNA